MRVTAVAALTLLFSSMYIASAESGCTQIQAAAGLCPSATTTDTDVILESSGGSPGSNGSNGGSGGVDASWPDSTGPVDPFADCIYALNSRCLVPGPSRAAEAQPITWADIAAFRPTSGTAAMEPSGWAVTGLDTNFYASSGSQVHEGALLGQPAAVRFTPVGFHWSYGDGSSSSLSSPGAPWASWGVGEFDPTPTSHVYDSPGTYTVTLVIDFAAEYRVGSLPWTSIPGTLAVPANPLEVIAATANTVLVDRECTRNPRGPGC